MTAHACPTPGKIAFESRSAANHSRGARRNKGRRMAAYRCPCGRWHLRACRREKAL